MNFSIGEQELKDCDDANVPVNIFITKVDEDEVKDIMAELSYREEVPKGWTPKWQLTADNFMSRRGLGNGPVKYVSDSKEELQALVREHVIPWYKLALKAVTDMADGKRNSFYYWLEKNDTDGDAD